MADNSKVLRLQVISPTRVFFDEDVNMVEMTTTEGEMGVLPEHIPLTAVLEPGELRIIQGEKVRKAALLDGFVEVRKDKITILAEACEWPEEIDIARANEAKIRAERRLKSGEGVDLIRAQLALNKALTRIRMTENRK